MFLSSCDVHEFPNPSLQEIPFVLHLNYDTELPLYKVINYNNETRTNKNNENYDIRYIVKVYPAEEENKSSERNELYQFIFTKDDISTLNHSVELKLKRGRYNFVVWSDYVKDNDADLYYNTSKFEEITLLGEEYIGNNDYRDAFKGTLTHEVLGPQQEATVEMRRPLAKFNFISSDVSEFITMIKAIRADKTRNNNHYADSQEQSNSSTTISANNIQFSDFNVVFRYHGFVPHVFNTYSNKPTDAKTGISFKSKISILENGEAELGFDYVFVNGTESAVNVSVEVYDYDGELISRFKPIDIPLTRSKLTTIKANFLTSGVGGVAIIPGFDGDYNYIVE